MDTLPDDLLGLIAKHDLSMIQSTFPTNQTVNKIFNNYMKSAYVRLMNDLNRSVSPEVLAIIKKYNMTISGSFVLRAICSEYTIEWEPDIDLIINNRNLTDEIISVLDLIECPGNKQYDAFGKIKTVFISKQRPYIQDRSNTWIDLIVLEDNGTVLDLLSSYDYEFVKNSLEFLADGSTRLTINSPYSVFSKKCVINIDNYGIDKARDSGEYCVRMNRFIIRTKKYTKRGFTMSINKQKFSKVTKDATARKCWHRYNLVDTFSLLIDTH